MTPWPLPCKIREEAIHTQKGTSQSLPLRLKVKVLYAVPFIGYNHIEEGGYNINDYQGLAIMICGVCLQRVLPKTSQARGGD